MSGAVCPECGNTRGAHFPACPILLDRWDNYPAADEQQAPQLRVRRELAIDAGTCNFCNRGEPEVFTVRSENPRNILLARFCRHCREEFCRA